MSRSKPNRQSGFVNYLLLRSQSRHTNAESPPNSRGLIYSKLVFCVINYFHCSRFSHGIFFSFSFFVCTTRRQSGMLLMVFMVGPVKVKRYAKNAQLFTLERRSKEKKARLNGEKSEK